ncbi:MAG: hypothetical protein JW969_01980 [Spirochaetales bacterium]|nr:hypothetical protein [Spirochaetales bacterium]
MKSDSGKQLITLSDKEKRLVYILTAVTILCISGLLLFIWGTDLASLEKSIAGDEADIKKVTSVSLYDNATLTEMITSIDEKIISETNKFFKPDEIDIAMFSLMVKRTIKNSGLTELSYKTVETNQDTFLEFQVSGNAYNLTKFLYAVSKAEKYWTINELIVKKARKGTGRVDITIRIMYETYSQVSN